MPNVSGSFSAKVHLLAVVSLKDVPDHELSLTEISGVEQSTDPLWNGTKITYSGSTDVVSGNGTQRGYWTTEDADGDLAGGTFEGRVTTFNGEVTTQGAYTILRGTGKFSGVSGSGTYRGRMTSPVGWEAKWEGAYQLGAARAAEAR